MIKNHHLIALLVTIGMVVSPGLAEASFPQNLHETFNDEFIEPWHFLNFEDDNGVFGVHPDVVCGTDACAAIVQAAPDKFLRITVNPSTTEGIYTNTDVSEVALRTPTSLESGPWTPDVTNPVVMEARVRWSAGYNFDGSGTSVGTSGIGLWNSAVGPNGPTPEYDQIGFSWTKNTVLGGFLAGFTAGSTVNFTPINVSRPASAININDWVNLKLVWAVDANGQQQVEYFVNGTSIGTHTLPEALHDMSVEMWNDNQEPTFTAEGFVVNYPSPSVAQSFEIDSVKVSK